MYVCTVPHIARVCQSCSWSADQGKYISLSVFAPENLVSRDGFGSPVPPQPAYLHTQAESGASSGDSSRVPRRRPFTYLKPPYAIGSVPSLSGTTIEDENFSLSVQRSSSARYFRKKRLNRLPAAVS